MKTLRKFTYYIIGLIVVVVIWFYYEQHELVNDIILKGLKNDFLFDGVTTIVIVTSGLHAFKYKKLRIGTSYSFDAFKNLIGQIGEILSVPIPFIGTFSIMKLWLLSIIENPSYLEELNGIGSASMILVAFYFLIRSSIEIFRQFVELKVDTKSARPI